MSASTAAQTGFRHVSTLRQTCRPSNASAIVWGLAPGWPRRRLVQRGRQISLAEIVIVVVPPVSHGESWVPQLIGFLVHVPG